MPEARLARARIGYEDYVYRPSEIDASGWRYDACRDVYVSRLDESVHIGIREYDAARAITRNAGVVRGR